MGSLAGSVLWISAIPALVLIASSALAFRWRPGPRVTSGLQHMAAGIVFAAVATELVPEMVAGQRYEALIGGFTGGVVLMLILRWLDERASGSARRRDGGAGPGLLSIVLVTGSDLAVDGFLVGVSYGLNPTTGGILATAITFETLFVGLSLAAGLIALGLSKSQAFGVMVLLGVIMVSSAVLGIVLYGVMSPGWQQVVISFGAAAMLYLVTEELLVRAHKRGDSAFGSTLFFVGFGATLLLAMVSGH
jgi:zinc transporter, ZIP family